MENASGKCRHTTGQEHVAELRNGGVGEDLFYIRLRDANGCRKQGGQSSDNRHHHQRGGRALKYHM